MSACYADCIRFFLGRIPSLSSAPQPFSRRPALPHALQPRFFRLGAHRNPAATKVRTTRTLPTGREYPPFQTSARMPWPIPTLARTFLRSNRWTGLAESDALAALRGAPCRWHGSAY